VAPRFRQAIGLAAWRESLAARRLGDHAVVSRLNGLASAVECSVCEQLRRVFAPITPWVSYIEKVDFRF
jgi:hypothetical protein